MNCLIVVLDKSRDSNLKVKLKMFLRRAKSCSIGISLR